MGNYFILYYEKATGNALVLRTLYNGEITKATPQEDYENFPELRNGDGIGNIFIPLTAEIEAALASCDIAVDIATDPPELVFTPLVIPEKPIDQRDEALKELGVEVYDNA